jgi:hypothetical protein
MDLQTWDGLFEITSVLPTTHSELELLPTHRRGSAIATIVQQIGSAIGEGMKGQRPILRALLVLLFLVPTQTQARLVSIMSYQERLAKSDLVVIANPESATSDTKEHSFLPNIWQQEINGGKSRIESIGVETRFTVCAVLKGNTNLKQFTLHHYREAQIPGNEVNGPGLVSFDPSRPERRSSYLLFLVREPDGRFAPVGGQTDPDLGSISPLPFEPH